MRSLLHSQGAPAADRQPEEGGEVVTSEQLDELEKLRLAATGGKWQHQRWPCQIWEGDGPEAEMCAAIGPIYAKSEQPNREQVYADAKFMEAMSEHALPLVKALREARAEVERLRGERDEYRKWLEGICVEFESTIAHAEWRAAGSKGMSVPFFGDFADAARHPGMIGRMGWWVRQFRAALKEGGR